MLVYIELQKLNAQRGHHSFRTFTCIIWKLLKTLPQYLLLVGMHLKLLGKINFEIYRST